MRDAQLQSFLDLTERAIAARAGDSSSIGAAAGRIFAALRGSCGEVASLEPQRLPVLDKLESALLLARRSALAPLTDALAAIEPRFAWSRRPGAEAVGPRFYDGHANAYIVGPGGLERRRDVLIGVSFMPPDIDYPVHDHPPEEIYVSLAGGSWWNSQAPWTARGPGELFYNPPGVKHAMATKAEPLLAIWCLWAGT